MGDIDRAARLSSTNTAFQLAIRRAQDLERRGVIGDKRHYLHGLLMQATAGDCSTERPPANAAGDDALNWMAWKKRHGMTREAARTAYIDQICMLDDEGNSLETPNNIGLNDSGRFGGSLTREDALSPYASTENVSKTGILYKQRDVFKGWRPRTFVLQGGMLSYYLSPSDPAPRKSLIVEGCSITTLDVPEHVKKIEGEMVSFYPFVISHPDSTTSYYLASTSKEETDEWIRCLQLAASPIQRLSLRRKTSLDSARIWRRSDSVSSLIGSDVGSPQSNEAARISKAMERKLDHALSALLRNTGSTDEWELAFNRNDVQGYRKPGALMSVRGEGIIAQHPTSILLALLDLENKAQYDPQFDMGRRVKIYNTHTFLDYNRFKAVWPSSPRDMYNIVHWRVLDEGKIVLIAYSDKDPYPEEDGCIRGDLIIAGWVIKPLEDSSSSQVSFLLQMDLKGSLTHRVKNVVAERQPMVIATLRKYLEEKGDSRNYRLGHTYSNTDLEPIVDNLNRHMLARESARMLEGKAAGVGYGTCIREIQSDLDPIIHAKVEDAVNELLEREKIMEGWDLFYDVADDKAYTKEASVSDLSVVSVRTAGTILHHPVAVLQAITTPSLINIHNSAIEFTSRDMVCNVHTWVAYMRLKAIYPMPTRDVCQLFHWRVLDDKSIVVVGIDHDSHPEEEGYQRAHLQEGWLLRLTEDGKGTDITCIWSMDNRSLITPGIKKKLSENQAQSLASLRKFLDEYVKTSGDSFEGHEISNVAIQPLMIKWNGWSPSILPDRIKSSKRSKPSSAHGTPRFSELTSGAMDLSVPPLNRGQSAPSPLRSSAVENVILRARPDAMPKPSPPPTSAPKITFTNGRHGNGEVEIPEEKQEDANVLLQAQDPSEEMILPFKRLQDPGAFKSGLIVQTLVLLSPVFIWFISSSSFRGLFFILGTVVAIRFVVRSPLYRPGSGGVKDTEWGQEHARARVYIKFPVEIKKLSKYLEAKRKEGATDVTISHLAMKAVGVALKEVPDLNCHTILDQTFPSKQVEVSTEIKLPDGGWALVKATEVHKKSLIEVASQVISKVQALKDNRDPFFRRRKIILKYCPSGLIPVLERVFSYLGSGLGFCIPAFGIRPFPQGACVVITPPPSSNKITAEAELLTEPHHDVGEYAAPIILTLGSVYTKAKLEGANQKLTTVHVINVALLIHPRHATLRQVRKFGDTVQRYLSDPSLIDAYTARKLVLEKTQNAPH